LQGELKKREKKVSKETEAVPSGITRCGQGKYAGAEEEYRGQRGEEKGVRTHRNRGGGI